MAALVNADALIIVTEWKAFLSPDFAHIKSTLKNAVIFDGRNMYEPSKVVDSGIEYFAIGRRA
jgi:UDPglucose 6-dehydrogenase